MTFSTAAESRLRRAFKALNRFMLLLWRLGLARFGNPSRYGGAIMVIKHRGHKTGLTRFAPVNYAELGENVYCTAGFGTSTHWYRNLMAEPEVELWLPESRWRGVRVWSAPGNRARGRWMFRAGFAGVAGTGSGPSPG